MIKVVSKDLKDAFEFVKNCISKDDNRPIMHCIHMVQKESILVVEAVDGYRLARISIHIQEHDNNEVPFEALIEYFKVDVVCDFAISELENDDKFLKITNIPGGEYYSHRLTRGQPFDSDNVIRQENPTFTISCNPKYLTDALKPYCKGRDKKSIALEFHGDMGAFFVTDGSRFHMILPLRR